MCISLLHVEPTLKELESAGYIIFAQARDAKGRIKGREYVFRELKAGEPLSEKPQAEPPQQNTTREDKPVETNRKKFLTDKEIQESFDKKPQGNYAIDDQAIRRKRHRPK